MKNIKFLQIIVIVTLLITQSFFISEATQKSSKTIIFGDDINYPPYSFIDENGNPSGYNVDLAYAVGETLGYDVKIQLSEWSKARENLENENIDVISGMFYSKEREKVVSFSTRHSVTIGDIFANPKYSIKDISELKNQIVAVQKG
ncbi:MAG: transporter substrate-binding domain-containing protein, partial [Proteocatella sp.]